MPIAVGPSTPDFTLETQDETGQVADRKAGRNGEVRKGQAGVAAPRDTLSYRNIGSPPPLHSVGRAP